MAARSAVDTELKHWREHGWTFVEGLLDRDETLASTAPALQMMYPTAEEFASDTDPRRNDRFRVVPEAAPAQFEQVRGPSYRSLQFAGNEDFPFPDPLLNRLVAHPSIIDIAERLLETTDIRIYQAQCMAKYTGATNYEQPLHLDYSTHTLLTPQPGQQVQIFLYLCDVTPDLAPTHVVSRTLTRDLPVVPRTLMPAIAPQLYAAETSAPGVAGSVFAYSPDTWHRGVNLTRPGGARFWLTLGFCRAGQDWLGFQAFQRAGLRLEWRRFVEESTPREIAIFGIPEPGHPYWTAATISEFALRYPGLDVTQWWQEMRV